MNEFLKRNGVWIGFALLVILLSIFTDGAFLSPRNISNLTRQASLNGLLAGGMTLVILTGGIDLSVGSVVALCGILAGVSQVHWNWANGEGLGLLGTIGLTLGAGTLLGLITGGLIAGLGMAPFIITLGMMVITRGLALILSEGASISPMSESMTALANAWLPLTPTLTLLVLIAGALLWRVCRAPANERADALFPLSLLALLAYAFLSYKGLPILGLFLSGALAMLGMLLGQTTFGRSIYALGSNPSAAYWAGVPIRKVTVLVYTLMGLLSGGAALLLTARLNGADPNAGQLFELDAIAAVVIGGTSLKGGEGGIMGSLIGAFMIAALNNGMDLLGVSSFYQMVLKGLIIIIAVALDQGQRKTA